MPERTALPGNPKARECAGAAATAGYSLAQDGTGDESRVTAGAILVQKSAAANPEFETEPTKEGEVQGTREENKAHALEMPEFQWESILSENRPLQR